MVEASAVLRGVPVKAVQGILPSDLPELCTDSRMVTPGAWFVALRGAKFDGHQFLRQAAEAGAGAAIVESADSEIPLAQIIVENTLEILPVLATNFFDYPARLLQLAGITGSNGKTSSTYLMESIWCSAGIPCGVLGTIEYRWPNQQRDAPNTTPLALDLQRVLRDMVNDGVRHTVMEVSSHALALHRVEGLRFQAALFTNLSHDHLDFHRDMEDYRAAKTRLFTDYLDGWGAINLDDKHGRIIFEALPADRRLGFAVDHVADVRAENIVLDRHGTRFQLVSPWGRAAIESSLIGRHNLENILGVCAMALALDVPLEVIAEGVKKTTAIPGRLESIENQLGATIVVDYAHTPDGLEKVLTATSKVPHRRLIGLFGCGGDRDKTKRPEMGEIALRYCDWTIVTSDNPRTEEPLAIIRDIESGMSHGKDRYEVEPDRRKAIRRGLQLLQTGDIFVIAGKGHETYQIVGTVKHPFDDRLVTRELLAEMEKRS